MLANVWIALAQLRRRADLVKSIIEVYSGAFSWAHLAHGVQSEVGPDVLLYLEVGK